MAAGWEDIPRIRSLMAAQLRAGASVFTTLEKVNQAAHRSHCVYSPRGYDVTDYEWVFLIYKLGGRAAANITHWALRIPSINSTKRHIMMAPLMSSPGFPTKSEMQSNLVLCYGTSANNPSALLVIVQGTMIAVDELKVQERLHWDLRSNYILGVCRERGD